MIYFSDLDRTLICSKKMIRGNENIKCVEKIGDEDISYISYQAIKFLRAIITDKMFIPATTRSKEQFERIKFEENGINFTWAIVSNGACILKNGHILESWEKEIDKIKKESKDIAIVLKEFESLIKDRDIKGIEKVRLVEGNFFYIQVEKQTFKIEDLEIFIKKLPKYKWTCYKSGRKIYFVPYKITKENAINYILKELDEKKYGCLGDSIMDFNMLANSDKAYIPKHGNIAKCFSHENMFISENEGFKGINELLECIHGTL